MPDGSRQLQLGELETRLRAVEQLLGGLKIAAGVLGLSGVVLVGYITWAASKAAGVQQARERAIEDIAAAGLDAKRTLDGHRQLTFRYLRWDFTNVQQGAVIPGSQGASFCALARADDDNPAASCDVSYNEDRDEWIAKTGADAKGNACAALCIWIQT